MNRYAFLFVCQQGELEIKAALLAASLRRYLRCQYELIAAVPAATEASGEPSALTRRLLTEMGVRLVPIANRVDTAYQFANKLSCFDIETVANKLVFLDSDILCMRPISDDPRFAVPFCAKPADIQTFGTDEAVWRHAYDVCGVPLSDMRLPTTVSQEYGLPYFNAGVIVVDAGTAFGEVWLDYCRKLQADTTIPGKSIHADQISLSIALQKLGFAYDCLDERYNYPAHLKPLDGHNLPYFCHYHTPEVLRREPALWDLVRALASAHPALAELLGGRPEWARLVADGTAQSAPGRSPTSPTGPQAMPNLVLTGLPSSGSEHLGALLNQHTNCVVLDEPDGVSQPVTHGRVPWRLATFYREVRADIVQGGALRHRLCRPGETLGALAAEQTLASRPNVDSADFVLGTKNLLGYLVQMDGIRRAMPDARIVVSVRNPFDTIAAWKRQSRERGRPDVVDVALAHVNTAWLPAARRAALLRVASVSDLAQRRAMWWQCLAELILDQAGRALIVDYASLVNHPTTILAQVLGGLDAGRLRGPLPTAPAQPKGRAGLDAADLQAIRAICCQSAAELGVLDLGEG